MGKSTQQPEVPIEPTAPTAIVDTSTLITLMLGGETDPTKEEQELLLAENSPKEKKPLKYIRFPGKSSKEFQYKKIQ